MYSMLIKKISNMAAHTTPVSRPLFSLATFRRRVALWFYKLFSFTVTRACGITSIFSSCFTIIFGAAQGIPSFSLNDPSHERKLSTVSLRSHAFAAPIVSNGPRADIEPSDSPGQSVSSIQYIVKNLVEHSACHNSGSFAAFIVTASWVLIYDQKKVPTGRIPAKITPVCCSSSVMNSRPLE